MNDFWRPVTICKMVRPMLSHRSHVCSVCPVLSVTLVYCGQTVGWITMKLGMEVGLGPCNIVLDEDAAPFQTGHSLPQFWPLSIVVKRLDGSRCHLVGRYTSAQATLC